MFLTSILSGPHIFRSALFWQALPVFFHLAKKLRFTHVQNNWQDYFFVQIVVF
jgi:hypothetical protein